MKKSIFIFILTLIAGGVFAMPQDWTVNSSDYEYSMTITGQVKVNGDVTGNTNDAVAAFVGQECRGVTQAQYVESANGFYFFLTVFSNEYSGEELSFKFYQNDGDSIYTGFSTLEFVSAENHGTASNPYYYALGEASYELTISHDTILENNAIGRKIGLFTATRNGMAADYNFGLVNYSEYFAIVNDSLIATKSLNYENQSNYNIKVNGFNTDSSAFFTDSITLSVVDVYEPMTIELSANSIAENDSTPYLVGQFMVNAAEGLNYTLELDTILNAGYFYLQNDSLMTDSVFNYEQQDFYELQLLAVSSENDTVKEIFSINILDADDAPEFAITNASVLENQPEGTFVGKITFTDEDPTDSYSYSLPDDSVDNALFTMVNDSVFTSSVFNYESQSSYTIEVVSTKNKSTGFSTKFNIDIADANDVAVISLSDTTIIENADSATMIGEIVISDEDVNDSYTSILQADSLDNRFFTLLNDTLYAAQPFNYEADSVYAILLLTVENATDSIYTELFIKVLNQIEAATLSDTAVVENSETPAYIGTFNYEAMTEANQLFLASDTNQNSQYFYFDGMDLYANTAFNYEEKNEYPIIIDMIDESQDTTHFNFTIAVTDTNEAPFSLNITNDTISENQPARFVGVLSADDEDLNDTIEYILRIPTGNHFIPFEIHGDSLFTNASIDYETDSVFVLSILAKDKAGLVYEGLITINVNDVVESGIQENKQVQQLVIYPNPAKADVVYFNQANLNKVAIYNARGQKVKELSGENLDRLNIGYLKAGIYFVRGIGKEVFYTGTFLKRE